MIHEEYWYKDIQLYLDEKVNLLIMGFPGKEERSRYFYEKWASTEKEILMIECIEKDKVRYKIMCANDNCEEKKEDISIGIPRILKRIDLSKKVVLLDLASLNNVLIMFLTKQLLLDNIPKDLFATYIRPESYSLKKDNINLGLSDKICAIESVPGFVKREAENQVLCAFIGFEGIRLKGVLESVQKTKKIIPIVAFPSGALHWYNITMWNIMDTLENETNNLMVNKCLSESVFDAVDLLEELTEEGDKVVLVPLGTRVHSMACAVYACRHKSARIIYDFVVESEDRAVGIADIKVYHLELKIQKGKYTK